jgi:hypothetical protein
MCLYSCLSYPTCRAHESYQSSVACLALPHFFHFISYTARFSAKKFVLEHKTCVVILILSTTFVWNIYHSTKNSARYCRKCTQVFVSSTRYSCKILKKLGFSRQIFKKSSNIKFHENLSSGSRVAPCEHRTDRHEPNSHFRNFANALEKSGTGVAFKGIG